MRKYYRAAAHRFEQWLIKVGVLATPEEDEYYAWADQYLDELESRRRIEARLAQINKSDLDDEEVARRIGTWKGHNR